MSFRNQYSGSPWQHGGPPFGMSNYGQNFSSYDNRFSVMSMNAGYGRNQGGYGDVFAGGYINQMRNVGYDSSPSRYGNNMMGGNRNVSRGQMQRKRLPPRSPLSGPRSKRPNLNDYDRRSSKPVYRRESRGGSKGRGRDHSDGKNESYNPAEPTDDVSDNEFEGYEIFKCSSEEDEASIKENGEKAEDVKKSSEKSSKKHVCYVCKVVCSSEQRLKKHQTGEKHTTKINELLAIRQQKKESDEEDEIIKKKSSRNSGSWCTVCEIYFSGNFLAHRRTKDHRKKRDKKYPKCRPCRIGFTSLDQYRNHFKSLDHKNKSAEFHFLRSLASCSDDDEEATQPIKVDSDDDVVEKVVDEIKMDTEESEPVKANKDKLDDEPAKEKLEKPEEDSAKVEKEKCDDESSKEKKEKMDDENEKKEDVSEKAKDDDKIDGTNKKQDSKSKSREPKVIGQSFVLSVQGYYCKLCRKFFRDVVIAKSRHCRTAMHLEKFKTAMEAAMEQEEERQRLADEQEKLDEKAAEEAKIASEIAAIEQSAKEAARREFAKKRASKGSKDVEMKEVVKVETKVEKPEKEACAASETTEAKPENDDDKAKDPEAESEKTSPEKPAEVAEESPDVDDEAGDEQEKTTKEEVASSPTTKRGRGRGRGRKRR